MDSDKPGECNDLIYIFKSLFGLLSGEQLWEGLEEKVAYWVQPHCAGAQSFLSLPLNNLGQKTKSQNQKTTKLSVLKFSVGWFKK